MEIRSKVFTVKEYVTGYLGVDSYYITHNLDSMTVTVNKRNRYFINREDLLNTKKIEREK